MKKMVAPLAAACILMFPPLFAQVPCSGVPIPCEQYKLRDIHLQELVNLEKENARAIQLNNPSFFQATYADDFYGVTWYGERVSKDKLIRLIQAPEEKYSSVTATNIEVKMFVDSASVLSLRSERGKIKDKPVDRQFRVLRVYIYTLGGWRVVSQLETQLPTTLQQR